MRVLCLCSWYPDEEQPYNGDFVQRQILAVAPFCALTAIHVYPSVQIAETDCAITTHRCKNAYEEVLVKYRKANRSLFSSALSHYRFLKYFKLAIANYVKENGVPDIVHVHVMWRAGILGRWMKRKYGVNYITTEHWSKYVLTNSAVGYLPLQENKIMREASIRLVVSQYLGEGINRYLGRHYPMRILSNVVDTSVFKYDTCQEVKDARKFIHVSDFSANKHVRIIIEAFLLFSANNAAAELILIGAAPADLKTEYSHPAIRFKGYVAYEQIPHYLNDSDVFLMASGHEMQPCVLLESLCCGLPIIATKVGGIPEVVSDRSKGILIDYPDAKLLADAMAEMSQLYHTYDREKIAKDAQSKYSYAVIGKELMDIYTEASQQKNTDS